MSCFNYTTPLVRKQLVKYVLRNSALSKLHNIIDTPGIVLIKPYTRLAFLRDP